MTLNVQEKVLLRAKMQMNPSQIGWLFVQQYYTFLNESPERLYLFYNTNSIFTHGKEGENVINVVGQQAINHDIRSKQFQNCRVFVSNVDSQASASGGVVVQVLGELSNNNDACHKFCQTFFLAEQPAGYYVLNDIFRFLKEELELSDGEKTLEDRSTPPVFNFQETKAATSGAIVASIPSKKEKAAVQEKPKPVVQKPTPNGTAPNPVPVKVEPSKPAVSAQKPKTPQPAKQTQQSQQPALKPTTALAATNVDVTAPSQTAVPVKSVPAVSGDAQVAEKKTAVPVEKRPASPVKKAAPASWSKVVSSAEPAAVPTPQPQAPTKPVLVKAAAKEKKPVTPQGQQPKKLEENADGFQDVPTRHRNVDRNKSNEGIQSSYLEKDKATIYIRNVAESMDKKLLQEAFEKFGPVQHVDLPSGKHIAFVTFKSIEFAQAAIGKSITVLGVELLAEERKKNFAQKQNGNATYRGGGAGFQSRGGRGGIRPSTAQRGRGSEQK